ncbi:EAL domain-containing protein [Cellulomonas oligotrophica]|uniref:EAL and modified HD-GYP domain-containing signal transduction protein n=1 Tax=Cellulomonas oligotrophica TaxID=931536 RepID=A0A7Y9JXV0_9CELL|nr:EAL domain-containing protein [Cellulomonas oligotrophica]NYD85114.1 EAL and modified HD-GYP domain-containing signal transduction protein [Cellulomonas oligotrophica]GIG33818.1 hypothetical protein Col01nite_29770 [Cellulomonas oligotrophica]
MTTRSRAHRPRHVARQPIWTPDGRLLGHEYLYRTAQGLPAGVDRWEPARQDLATRDVLAALYDSGAPAGTGLVFVNVTRTFLVGGLPLPAPDTRLVLEVVETVDADAAVLDGLAALRAAGYRIALDDWTGTPAQQAMLPLADYVKVDCRDLHRLGPRGLHHARSGGARLVAERVSGPDLVDVCRLLRFDLLQGNALGMPALCA